jgi:hypothetical protein
VVFDGTEYGSLLFQIAVGLSVTMGLMKLINLAHGAFAATSGYVCVVASHPARGALPSHAAARVCRERFHRYRLRASAQRVSNVPHSAHRDPGYAHLN